MIYCHKMKISIENNYLKKCNNILSLEVKKMQNVQLITILFVFRYY